MYVYTYIVIKSRLSWKAFEWILFKLFPCRYLKIYKKVTCHNLLYYYTAPNIFGTPVANIRMLDLIQYRCKTNIFYSKFEFKEQTDNMRGGLGSC